MNALSSFLSRCRLLCALALAAVLSMGASPGFAEELRYHYVGNAFEMRVENIRVNPGDPNQYRYFEVSLDADIYMPTTRLLQAGDTLEDVSRFSMTLNVNDNGFRYSETIFYPHVPYCFQCGVHSETEAALSIGAIGMFALPTDWDFSISRRFILPTGRHDFLELASSDSLDRLYGFYETFTGSSGQLAGARGVWSLSVVPEPATCALMLAGGGLLGWAARRRREVDGPRAALR